MKYTRSIVHDGNLYPAVFNALRALPDEMLHHQEHDLVRHPLATYNLSMRRIVDALQAVLERLKEFDSAAGNDPRELNIDADPLLKAQKDLLDALASHIDDGYQILKAIYPAAKFKRDEPFADRWLIAAGHSQTLRVYKDAISLYRNSFMPIVNRIKHATGRLRACVLSNDRQLVPGYFLDSVGHKGVVGPDPTVHPGNTALSLNRDVRYHFCHLYDVDEALKLALVRAAQKDYHLTLPVQPVSAIDEQFKEVAENISNLPLWFFPDEVAKVTPLVSFTRTDSDTTLTVEETRATVPFAPNLFRCRVVTTGDGVTRSWRFPYMQYAQY